MASLKSKGFSLLGASLCSAHFRTICQYDYKLFCIHSLQFGLNVEQKEVSKMLNVQALGSTIKCHGSMPVTCLMLFARGSFGEIVECQRKGQRVTKSSIGHQRVVTDDILLEFSSDTLLYSQKLYLLNFTFVSMMSKPRRYSSYPQSPKGSGFPRCTSVITLRRAE